ncbi:TetR/AcrR family transcriptional regulator [Phytoactinopolyspora halotolerans]|uniref:TetR/AcrR family transcriptional regulator n=1 Tax=Phytoactinopolyspora halotolerans TaxID=1981512 RepID=A0A6L9SD51_9ACTN|nr:TetR/AcrR family transcriptional regulator [Phytoactinopolyspora halotolerans]NEE03166.1 TetR/AcrR family transcriptional regulator [Phytoactinopolyspora halotolerans]
MTTRDRILDAAAQIMRGDGIARATTKEIASRAGFSEATLYKHFPDKVAIFTAVLNERLPDLGSVLQGLPERVGKGSVEENLRDVAAAALRFYEQGFPMAMGLFSERRLLAAYRDGLQRHGAGPRHVNLALRTYLESERQHGRVRPDVDVDAAAALLLGACFQDAFYRHFYDESADEPAERARSLARTVVAGLVVPAAGDDGSTGDGR